MRRMKVLQIALMVVAGAIAGAVVMKLTPLPHEPLQRAETPTPADASTPMAQVVKPSPVGEASSPADVPPAAASEPPRSASAPSAERDIPSTPRPANRTLRERLTPKPAYTPPIHSAAAPATPERREHPTPVRDTPPPRQAAPPERTLIARNAPPRPAPGYGPVITQADGPPAPPRAAEKPNPAPRPAEAQGSHTLQDEFNVPAPPSPPAPIPAPLPEARQERPIPPATPPPARIEPEKVTPAPPPPPEIHKATLNAGMIIPVRLVESLSTERNKPGDKFTATLLNELIAGEFIIAERGARVDGQVVASDPGRYGAPVLTVVLTALHTSDGQTVPVRTDGFEQRLPTRGAPAMLTPDLRIPFRLGVSVTLTERTSN